MNRLLLRVWGTVLAVLIIANLLSALLFVVFFDTLFFNPEWYPLNRTAFLVKDVLDKTRDNDLDQEILQLSRLLDRTITLSDNKPALSGQDSVTFSSSKSAERTVSISIHDDRYRVTYDVLPRRYRPKITPGMLIAYLSFEIILSILFGAIILLPLLASLKRLKQVTAKIRGGDMDIRISPLSEGLIGDIELYFNQISDIRKENLASQQQLLRSMAQMFGASFSSIRHLLEKLQRAASAKEQEASIQSIEIILEQLEFKMKAILTSEKEGVQSALAYSDNVEHMKNQDVAPKTANVFTLFLSKDKKEESYRRDILRYIFRSGVGILCALIMLHIFTLFLAQFGYRYLAFDPNWYSSRTLAALVQRSVNKTPATDLQRSLEFLEVGLEREIRLIPYDLLSQYRWKQSLDAGHDINYGLFEGKKVLVWPVKNTDKYMVMDLAYQQYRPPPSILLHMSLVPIELVFILACALAICAPLIRNLLELEAGIKNIRDGLLSTRIERSRFKAFRQLSDSINAMAAYIHSALIYRKSLLQAIAHEVRTPISRVQFQLVMIVEAEDSKEVDQRCREICGDLNELTSLVDELSNLIEDYSVDSENLNQNFSIGKYLENWITSYKQQNQKIDFILNAASQSESHIQIYPLYVKLVLNNILSNAVKYAKSEITVNVSCSEERLLVEVIDDGPGLSSDLEAQLQQSVQQADPQAVKSTSGYGMGLTIANRMVAHNKGQLEIHKNASTGLRIVFSQPLV